MAVDSTTESRISRVLSLAVGRKCHRSPPSFEKTLVKPCLSRCHG